VVALTVLLSVVLHGVSAGPFGSRYVRAEAHVPGSAEAHAPRAWRPGHRHRTDPL
jgi:sodium/hydrogen antiporter